MAKSTGGSLLRAPSRISLADFFCMKGRHVSWNLTKNRTGEGGAHQKRCELILCQVMILSNRHISRKSRMCSDDLHLNRAFFVERINGMAPGSADGTEKLLEMEAWPQGFERVCLKMEGKRPIAAI